LSVQDLSSPPHAGKEEKYQRFRVGAYTPILTRILSGLSSKYLAILGSGLLPRIKAIVAKKDPESNFYEAAREFTTVSLHIVQLLSIDSKTIPTKVAKTPAICCLVILSLKTKKAITANRVGDEPTIGATMEV
jgi:hypothetical protein